MIGEAPSAIAGETVVLVEDDPAVRMLVLDLLKELGYHAYEAEDAKTALPLLESDLRVDLLVTDVGLPGHEWPATGGDRPSASPGAESAVHDRLRAKKPPSARAFSRKAWTWWPSRFPLICWPTRFAR